MVCCGFGRLVLWLPAQRWSPPRSLVRSRDGFRDGFIPPVDAIPDTSAIPADRSFEAQGFLKLATLPNLTRD